MNLWEGELRERWESELRSRSAERIAQRLADELRAHRFRLGVPLPSDYEVTNASDTHASES